MAKNQSSFVILYKAEDQASDRAGKIMRQQMADLEKFQRDAYAAQHSAQALEMRDLEDATVKARALYQRRADALVAVEQEAQKRLAALRMENAGRRATPEITAQQQELSRVRAMQARNSDVMAAITEADAAKRAKIAAQEGERRAAALEELERRTFNARHNRREREIRDVREWEKRQLKEHVGDAEMRAKIAEAAEAEITRIQREAAESRWKFLNSPSAGRMLLGGAIAKQGYEVARSGLDYYQGSIAARSAAAGGTAEEVAAAAASGKGRVGDMAVSAVEWIPGVGPIFRDAYDRARGKAGLEALTASVRDSDQRMAASQRATREAAFAVEATRMAAYGIGGPERLDYELRAKERARAERLAEAQQAAGMAAGDLGRARGIGYRPLDLIPIPGVSGNLDPRGRYRMGGMSKEELDVFERRSRSADRYVERLRTVDAQEAEYARKATQRAKELEQVSFDRSVAMRQMNAGAMGVAGLAVGHEQQRAELRQRHAGELDQFRGLDQRLAEIADPAAWQAQHIQTARAQGRFVTQDEARKAFAEEQAGAQAQAQRRQQIVAAQAGEGAGLERVFGQQQLTFEEDMRLRRDTAALSGDPSMWARHGAERVQFDSRRRSELQGLDQGSSEYRERQQTLNAEDAAMRARQSKDLSLQEVAWRQQAVQARLSSSVALSDAIKRELDALQHEYEERQRLAEGNKQLTDANQKLYESQTAAAKSRAARQQRSQDAGFNADLLSSLGLTQEAAMMQSQERFAQLRERFTDDPKKLSAIDQMGELDRLRARASGPALEQQAVESRFATRLGGFSMPPEAQEIQKLQAQMRADMAEMITVLRQLLNKPPVLVKES